MNNYSLLREAISRMAQFQGKLFVLKISGKVFASSSLKEVLEDAANLLFSGIRLVLVCGAGVQIDEKMKTAGIDIVKKNGIRITPPIAIELIQSVCLEMRARIMEIVEKMENKPAISWPEAIVAESLGENFGRTGKIDAIETGVFKPAFIKSSCTPKMFLVSSLAKAKDGNLYNVNADEIAAAIAIALRAKKIIFLSDGGVHNNNGTIFSRLSISQAEELIKNNTASDGMVSKLKSVVAAAKGGVKSSHIVGYNPGGFLMEIFSTEGLGTIIEG